MSVGQPGCAPTVANVAAAVGCHPPRMCLHLSARHHQSTFLSHYEADFFSFSSSYAYAYATATSILTSQSSKPSLTLKTASGASLEARRALKAAPKVVWKARNLMPRAWAQFHSHLRGCNSISLASHQKELRGSELSIRRQALGVALSSELSSLSTWPAVV